MRILITGANGYLGQHLCKHLAAIGYDIVAVGRGVRRIPDDISVKWLSADLSDPASVSEIIKLATPDVLIHAAAMSRPDDCLKHPDLAYQMNVVATRYLVQAYNKYGVSAGHFIYVSTDFVFGNGGPHAEDATFNPLNYYGSTKWQAEQEMNNFNGLQTIIRPVFIYGQAWSGIRPGFIQWVANSVTAGIRIKVVNDQFRTPTYAPDICHAVHVIIEKKAEGAFHLAGFEVVTPYDLALAVLTLHGGHQGLVTPVVSSSFTDTADRPSTGGLLSNKAASVLNFRPILLNEGLEMSLASYLSGI